jgi:hypothetical protein
MILFFFILFGASFSTGQEELDVGRAVFMAAL